MKKIDDHEEYYHEPYKLVVRLPLHPVAGRKAAEQKLPALVVGEDQEREGSGNEPPLNLQWVHLQRRHTGTVDQEDCQESLKDQGKVHAPIPHSLLEH